jgi:hypothetical protein
MLHVKLELKFCQISQKQLFSNRDGYACTHWTYPMSFSNTHMKYLLIQYSDKFWPPEKKCLHTLEKVNNSTQNWKTVTMFKLPWPSSPVNVVKDSYSYSTLLDAHTFHRNTISLKLSMVLLLGWLLDFPCKANVYALLSITYAKHVPHDFGGLPTLCVEAVLFQCIILLP